MTHPFSDEQLNAYLDGELSPETRLQVEEAARAQPELARRLEHDRAIGNALREALDPVLDEPIPARLLHAVAPRPWPWRARIAAGLACAALGAAVGWQAATQIEVPARLAAARPITLEAAAAHAVYVPEKRHAVEVVSSEKAHLNRWLSKRLSHELVAPDLQSQGFDLVGGRMVADTGTPAAQYMYEDASKNRITIYVRREPGALAPTELRFAEDRGFKVVHWERDQMSYAVTGTLDRQRMMQLATGAQDQL